MRKSSGSNDINKKMFQCRFSKVDNFTGLKHLHNKIRHDHFLFSFFVRLELYIGCFNIHGTPETANNSSNIVVFFFVTDVKIIYINNY